MYCGLAPFLKNNWRYLLAVVLLSAVAIGWVLASGGDEYVISGVREYTGGQIPALEELERQQYPDEMRSIILAVEKWYALGERKQIDAEDLRAEFIPRSEDMTSTKEFMQAGIELFARLQNPHAQFVVFPFGRRVQVDLIEDRLIITAAGEEVVSEHPEIEAGAQIVAVDETAANQWLSERGRYVSSANAHWRLHGAAGEVFLCYPFEDEVRSYDLAYPDGSSATVDIRLDRPHNEIRQDMQLTGVTHKRLGDTGYIALGALADGVVEEFDRALSEVIDTEALILDLRRCGGGNSLYADEIFRRFIQSETSVWVGSPDYQRTAEPYHDLNYSAHLVVLTGPYTFSAAEGLAFDIYDADRALFVGGPTRGCSGGGPRTFVTDGGFLFRFPTRGVDHSAAGTEMEGGGLIPHVQVEQTLQDYYLGVDTVLEHARKLLSD